ncbi:HNH endonuclease [Phaeobacter gallaeciensis]|uniref:HNH endonuclease n=1 Tax=Phaeobacter gallaeciensis TaxID=60890 RepID=UPI00237FEA65|nr:HNH endonuclease [Phaeobacter gallaeciensis]MDE4297171.1 HNH endonuclease [Phaeobacter gallaeciensis]
MSRFPKDNWIKDALAKGYIIARENGDIYRAKRATKDGVVDRSAGYAKVAVQVHKKTGRVYFNMTWRNFKKSVLVNRIVAWRFHPNPDNLPQVNHKDGNKENNAKDNLEWATGSENEKHAHRTGLKSGRGSANSNAKLTVADVHAIRASDNPVPALCDRYGVSRSTITNIRNNKTWTHV